MKLKQILFLAAILSSWLIKAQDYSKQFEVLQKSIESKNIVDLQPFISSEMAIPPMIKKEQLTTALLSQVLEGVFKEINTVSLKAYKKDEMIVFYDFIDEQVKDRASSVLFDSEGKIKEIKIIAALIKEAQERKLGKDAEQPIADEFTKKYPSKKVEFETSDNRSVIGNLYDIGKDKPVILLCHQSGTNKYEYADIAPKLNDMGFNALAIDLTGGGTFAVHNNETVDKGISVGTSPADRQIIFDRVKNEINTAVDYLHKKYGQKVTVWGSSYSASYAISVASKNKNVKASISFSGLANGLSEILKKLEKPVFMTSSKEEVPRVEALLKDVSQRKDLVHFIPKSEGGHGSSVLWNGQPYAEEYWIAVKSFLNQLK